jgi:hypothetical protein
MGMGQGGGVEMVIFMTSTLIVAIICGIVTYSIAIREARREIEQAFQEHIEAMHAAHRELVEDIESESKD